MSVIIPPGFAQVAFQFGLDGDPEVMATTCGVSLENVTVSHQLYAEALANLWSVEFGAAGYPASWRFLGVKLYVGQDGGPPVIAEAPRSIPGTANINVLPHNCAILVRKTSDLGGRSGRGRFYLPPCFVDESNVSPNGMIVSGAVNNLQGAMTGLFEGGEWVLLHDDVGPVIAPTPITAFVVQVQIATQRRRMRS